MCGSTLLLSAMPLLFPRDNSVSNLQISLNYVPINKWEGLHCSCFFGDGWFCSAGVQFSCWSCKLFQRSGRDHNKSCEARLRFQSGCIASRETQTKMMRETGVCAVGRCPGRWFPVDNIISMKIRQLRMTEVDETHRALEPLLTMSLSSTMEKEPNEHTQPTIHSELII